MGAPAGTGSCEPSPDGLGPSGFDPSRVKGWPDKNAPLNFEAIADPIIGAIRFAYTLERRHKRRSIPWTGPEISWREHATCPLIADRLKAGNLSYVEEDQGRDALEEIVSACIQLGIEQGRRLARSDASDLLDEAYGAKFTVTVGWDEFTHVHTQTGLIAEPVLALQKAIGALVDELARVQRCPRHRAITRDSDGSPKGGDAKAAPFTTARAGEDGIALGGAA